MAATNYHIEDVIEISPGNRAYLWSGSRILSRIGEPMPAVFDFDDGGANFRIEILYLQGRLETLNRSINTNGPNANSKFVLQVGSENPTSFLLQLESLGKKSHRHSIGSAWLLEDEGQRVVGVEVVVPQ